MSEKLSAVLVAILLCGACAVVASARQDDVLNDFVGTRGTGFGAPPGASKGGGAKTARKNSAKGSTKGAGVKVGSVSEAKGALGLGYTLYMKDASGDAVRVDPARQFREGESIRVGLEPNADGYLYIFHTENGRSPRMLYPHAALERGNNRRRAHMLETVPSTSSDWFTFDANPAVERLYIVLSREPLAGVPTGEALIRHCGGVKSTNCLWTPTAAVWQRITSASGASVVEAHTQVAGVDVPEGMLKRGLTLTKSAPAPSVVRMNAAAASHLLVTTIDLVHK